MKKTDEQLALELDAYLTARLSGRPLPPVSEGLQAEVGFVEELLAVTGRMEPEALFLSELEAQLVTGWPETAAPAKKKQTRPERESFWQNFFSSITESFTMKRTIFALGMTLALFVFAFMALSALTGGRGDEPGVIADVPATPAATSTSEALPTLPSLGSASGLGGGFGGGGGGGEGDSAMVAGSIRYVNPLSGTIFVLNTDLPGEPVAAVVYDNAGAARFTYEEAASLAARFGFSGPAYVEHYYIEPGSDWTPSVVYMFYSDTHQLAVGDSYFSYFNNDVYNGKGYRPMALPQSGAIAEAFLNDLGLLDFPYEMATNGVDVEFRRVVDGRAVIFPEFQVSVSEDGQIGSAFSTPMRDLTALGTYPLRTAEEAWQLLQAQGADFRQVFFNTRPGPDFVMPELQAPDETLYQYWNRQFADGQQVSLYSYPMVFIPMQADGTPAPAGSSDLVPRIVVDWYTLSGSPEQLWGVAEYVGQQIQLEGIYHDTAAGPVLEISSWAPQEQMVEYTYREGIVARDGAQTLLIVSDEEAFIIPDAPADLLDGQKIYISGYINAPVGSTAPSEFNWQGIGLVIEEPALPEDVQIDTMPVEGFEYHIGQATIEQVDLVYAVISVYDEATQTAHFTLAPVWRFQGTTDTNELIDIFVQAVPDELVAQESLN